MDPDGIGDDGARALPAASKCKIQGMQASIAASADWVVGQLPQHLSLQELAAQYAGVNTLDWYTQVIKDWLALHDLPPFCVNIGPGEKIDKETNPARSAWARAAWMALGHCHVRRETRQRLHEGTILPHQQEPLTENLKSAVVVETGVWESEKWLSFSWNAQRRPRFPCLQGAGGNVYLKDQILTSMWMLDPETGNDSFAPMFPIAAFPSWELPLPAGALRVGPETDGFYCHNLLTNDDHREVQDCFDHVRERQGISAVPQYTMIVDPNMHLTATEVDASRYHAENTSWFGGQKSQPCGDGPKLCWAATPFAVVPKDSSAAAIKLGPVNAMEEPDLEARVGKAFETVLSAAAPMLAALRRPSLLLPGPIQAVCKAQRIFLQPGEIYEGVWHVDGDDENVVAVVLYYYRYSSTILGGDIEFAGREVSDIIGMDASAVEEKPRSPHDSMDMLRRGRAPVKEGTCVVFSNHQAIHRILTMLNSSACDEAHRDFVAMFIIDQREPVGTTLEPECVSDDPKSPESTPYLETPRHKSFAQREQRRRGRLFAQLEPKERVVLQERINGQCTYSTGNGALAWIGWTKHFDSDFDDDMIEHFPLERGESFLKQCCTPPPLNRGLSYAAESVAGRFPIDVEDARIKLILGRIKPHASGRFDVNLIHRHGPQREVCDALPIVYAVSIDDVKLLTLLLQFGAKLPTVIPHLFHPDPYLWYQVNPNEEAAMQQLFGAGVVELNRGDDFEIRAVTLLAAIIRNLRDPTGLFLWQDIFDEIQHDRKSNSLIHSLFWSHKPDLSKVGTPMQWDDLDAQSRVAFQDLGWARWNFNIVHAQSIGDGAPLDVVTAIGAARRVLQNALSGKTSKAASDGLHLCRFDENGNALYLGKRLEQSVFWSRLAHRKLVTMWGREAVMTVLLIAGRGTIDGVALSAPPEMWTTILSHVRLFELGKQSAYVDTTSQSLAFLPPSRVYAGPGDETAAKWCAQLCGVYLGSGQARGCRTEVVSIEETRGRLRWIRPFHSEIVLELTTNPRRLRVIDEKEGQKLACSMFVEVMHKGTRTELGCVTALVINKADKFDRADLVNVEVDS